MKNIIYSLTFILSGCALLIEGPKDSAGEGNWVKVGSSILGIVKKYEITNVKPNNPKEWIIENFPPGTYKVGFDYSENRCKSEISDLWINFSISSEEKIIADESGFLGGQEFGFGPPGDEPYYSLLNDTNNERLIVDLTPEIKYNVKLFWRQGKGEVNDCSMTLKFLISKLHFGAK